MRGRSVIGLQAIIYTFVWFIMDYTPTMYDMHIPHIPLEDWDGNVCKQLTHDAA
jgi:hypothetical protein